MAIKFILIGSLVNELALFQSNVGELNLPGVIIGWTKWLLPVLFIIGVVIRRSYLSSVILFLSALLTHQMLHPVVNGGDLVVLFFMFLGIFCQDHARITRKRIRVFQVALANFCIILGQIQIAIIYLVSGLDKLMSQAWRDGEALFNLLHVDFYATNWVQKLTNDLSNEVLVLLSWVVILLELCFPIMVWFPKFRYWVLVAMVVFHCIIIFGFSLPDFGMVMIWTFVLFVSDPMVSFQGKRFDSARFSY